MSTDHKLGERNDKIARYWVNQESFGTTLVAVLIDDFGTEAFDWEPRTIREEIQAKYGVQIPQANMDRLMAMITALTTNMFYVSVETFAHVANALNGAEVDFRIWDPVTPEEAAWAITEVTLSDLPQKKESFEGRFSTEVKRFIGVILADAGIQHPPDVLKIAERDTGVEKMADETFADDPTMFEGFYKLSQSKSADVVKYVKANTAELVSQLNSLPLVNRDEKSWKAFMERARNNRAIKDMLKA